MAINERVFQIAAKRDGESTILMIMATSLSAAMIEAERLGYSKPVAADTEESRKAIRDRLQAIREELGSIAFQCDWIDHDAGRALHAARDDLHDAWSILRRDPQE